MADHQNLSNQMKGLLIFLKNLANLVDIANKK